MRTIKNLKFRDKKFYRYKYSNMSFDSVKGSCHSGVLIPFLVFARFSWT